MISSKYEFVESLGKLVEECERGLDERGEPFCVVCRNLVDHDQACPVRIVKQAIKAGSTPQKTLIRSAASAAVMKKS